MRLLLDTHVFLWYIHADAQLPISARDAIRDPGNEVFLSAASVWEAVIKYALNKLPLPEEPSLYLARQRSAHGIASPAIEESVLTHLAHLPALHRDPFDRLLIAQALHHGMTLVSLDAAVRAYPVPVLPA